MKKNINLQRQLQNISEPYSHFGDMIHLVQNELNVRLKEKFSKIDSCLKNGNPNRWVDIVETTKLRNEKQFAKLFKKEILDSINEILSEIVQSDNIIKKMAWLYQHPEILYSEIENRFLDNKKKFNKKEYEDCVKFSFDYQITSLQSDDTDLVHEIKSAFNKLNYELDTNSIIKKLITFRDERDWGQFHNPKDLALAINVEAGELLELFLWKNSEEANIEKIKEELADVFAYAFLFAEKYKFDVKEIVLEKIKKNAVKYPVEKARGTAKKYNEL